MVKSGIYQIRNTTNGKRYVGSTGCLRDRLTEHKRGLAKGTHPCIHLQNAFNRYGPASFVFEVIEECSIEDLLVREQYYIDLHKERGLYNHGLIAAAPSRGYRHTEAAKEKIRLASIARIGLTTFAKGLIPWNKGVKGSIKANSGSFTKDRPVWNRGLKGRRPYMNLEGLKKGRWFLKGTKGVAKANSGSFKKGHKLHLTNPRRRTSTACVGAVIVRAPKQLVLFAPAS